MRKVSYFLVFFLASCSLLIAQKKQITLDEIWGGEFRTEGMDVLRSMKNGKQYTVLNFNRNPRSSSLDKYDYETLEKVANNRVLNGEHPLFHFL